jgi:anthranilate/para-aminobenzoate synthase component I
VVLSDATGSAPSYVACDPATSSSELDPEPSLTLSDAPREDGRVPRWVGVLPYEACRTIERSRADALDARAPAMVERIEWFRYDAVVEVGERVRIVGDSESSVRALERKLSEPPHDLGVVTLELAEPPEPPELHRARIRAALELIARGELYEVNLARRFVLRASGHPLGLLREQSARTRAPFGALISLSAASVVASSPELFLELEPGGRLRTRPIKGTRPRGATVEADRALERELANDPKEQAELVMVVDIERNDFGRIAEPGSVRMVGVPRIESHPTVHHRVATVEATLRRGEERTSVLRATLPSGSVTGAPKIRAMEAIAELEPARRGLYTGAFGAITRDGGLRLGMAIRTLCVQASGLAHYFAGGGIVADSDPERELEETLWKALHVLGPSTALGGTPLL